MDRDERFSFANNWLPLRDREDLFTREQLQILFHAVVARESIIRISQRVLAVNFHTFYHEADVVGPAVLVEVYCEERKKKKKKERRIAIVSSKGERVSSARIDYSPVCL